MDYEEFGLDTASLMISAFVDYRSYKLRVQIVFDLWTSITRLNPMWATETKANGGSPKSLKRYTEPQTHRLANWQTHTPSPPTPQFRNPKISKNNYNK